MNKNFCVAVKFLIPFLTGLILGFLIFQYFFFREFQFEIPQIPLQKPEISKETKEEDLLSKEYRQKKVEVDLFLQKMILFGDDEKILEASISSGKKETPTPTGNFRVIYKAPMIYSKAAECWAPFWVGFTENGQYGFHEIPICDEKRVGGEDIGEPASLGCIRLKTAEAENFYNFIEIGTKIEIYSQTP